MLHRAPRRLQQEPMLRVHQPDLARRHTEERRVEPRHVIDETRTTGHDLAGRAGFRVEEFVDIPAVLGHLRYRVPALAQHVPELVCIRRRPENAPHSRRWQNAVPARSDLRRIPCGCPPCVGGEIRSSAETCSRGSAMASQPSTDARHCVPGRPSYCTQYRTCGCGMCGADPGAAAGTLASRIGPRGYVDLATSDAGPEPAKPGVRKDSFAHREDNDWRN